MLKLAHIAGPPVFGKAFHGGTGDRQRIAGAVLNQKMLNKQRQTGWRPREDPVDPEDLIINIAPELYTTL